MIDGRDLTIWTIRLSLALYAATGWRLVTARRLAPPGPWRWIWAASCLLFLTHVACAFHYFHDWSHAAAVRHTAAETLRLVGVEFGLGLYFNHLFAAIWLTDAIWWLAAPAAYAARGRRLALAVHAYMLFIVFNGAVVFEDGPLRWAAIGACCLVIFSAARSSTPLSREAPASG